MLEYMAFFVRIVVKSLFSVVLRTDLARENMLLLRENQILKRKQKKVRLTNWDRIFYLGIYHNCRRLTDRMLIIKPETILKWFRKLKRHHTIPGPGLPGRPRLNDDIRRLILKMKSMNTRWGAKKISGELKKLGLMVCKKTVAKVLKENGFLNPSEGNYLSWMKFMKSQGKRIFACDFFKVPTLFSKTLYVFFVMDIDTRAVVQFGVHWMPNKEWIKNMLRSLFAFSESPPGFMISDRDCVFGKWFERFLLGNYGIKLMKIPFMYPQFNGRAERFVRTVREELLDRIIIYNEHDLHNVLHEYISYYNRRRTHSALGFDAPKCSFGKGACAPQKIRAKKLLAGLITDFEDAA